MTNVQREYDQHDGMENALGCLKEAETAGVFGATRLDAAALLQQGRPRARNSTMISPKYWAPFAAAAMLVLGVWGAMWNAQLGKLRSQKVALTSTVVESDCDGAFLKCFNGLDRAKTACLPFDYDRDGDVDLADYRTYQMDCDGPVAMR